MLAAWAPAASPPAAGGFSPSIAMLLAARGDHHTWRPQETHRIGVVFGCGCGPDGRLGVASSVPGG